MLALIDTHSHLDAAEFDADRDAVWQRARAAGVTTQIIPAVTADNLAAVTATCSRYSGCLPAWGLHPIYRHGPDDLARLEAQIEAQRPVAIGEIGLDFFVEGFDAEAQTAIFVAQLQLARRFELPVLLHTRRAVDATLALLRRYPVCGGIAHAFSGSPQQAEAFDRLGFKLGFGGACTYPRATRLQRLAVDLPLAVIVLETDSPDIPPAWLPLENRRNEPAELAGIARHIAALRGIPVDELAEQTRQNVAVVLNLSQYEHLLA